MSKSVITIGKNFEIKTAGLDRVMAVACFAFGEKDGQRDELLRDEIRRHVRPYIDEAMAASDLYTKLQGEVAREGFRKRFYKAVAKRYADLFHGEP